MKHIVFSDVDGTLLTGSLTVLDSTVAAIRGLQQRGIPFVILSGRSPSGIYPIMERYGFCCPIALYNGALILGEDREILFHRGISRETAREMLAFLDSCPIDVAWCLYSLDQWLVRDRSDPRILREEAIVGTTSAVGGVEDVKDAQVSKILCIVSPEDTLALESLLRERFPGYSVARSSVRMVEIMAGGVTKATAVEELCRRWGVAVEDTVAFGDNYNDIEMLECAGRGILMGNASDDLKARFPLTTEDNEHDGIYRALCRLGLLEPGDI